MLAVHPSPDGREGVQGRRVAVTGIGVVAPCGIGRDAFLERPARPPALGPAPGQSRLRCHRSLRPQRCPAGGPLHPVRRGGSSRGPGRRRRSGCGGGLTPDPDRTGVIIGTGVGGLETLETQIGVFRDKGARRVSPFLVPMMMGNRAAADVSMRYGFRGPCEATVTACAAGYPQRGQRRPPRSPSADAMWSSPAPPKRA